jgi:hypothetical protein
MNNTKQELIRISNENPERIEYSTDNGKSWHIRYIGNTVCDIANSDKRSIEISLISLNDKDNHK